MIQTARLIHGAFNSRALESATDVRRERWIARRGVAQLVGMRREAAIVINEAGTGGAPHFLFTVFLTFPVAFGVGVPGTVGVSLGTGNGTGLTAEAPEIP